eukprot:6102271-Lingulodinium_polyedra.AAC.1
MVLAGRIWALLWEPPCTTFSLARHPALRSSRHPDGFDLSERQTAVANALASSCLALAALQDLVGN